MRVTKSDRLKKLNINSRTKILSMIVGFLFILMGIEYATLKPPVTVKAAGADDFVTTWRVEASDPEITIYTGYTHPYDTSTDADYNYTIYWGDGSSETVNDKNSRTHTYAAAGDYQVRIEGTIAHFSACYLWEAGVGVTDFDNAKKLISIDQWGTNRWKDAFNMFAGAENMVGNYTDAPDTSQVQNMGSMFEDTYLFNSPVDFDTSNVTSMRNMFYAARSFNQPLNFNTSNVTNMRAFLYSAESFDQPINLDTSNAIDMSSMFAKAHALSHPIILDASSATNMAAMFYDKRDFNQTLRLDNTSNVTNMGSMFAGTYYNQSLDWLDTSSVTSMGGMLYNNPSFNQPLNFDTSNVTNMDNMFNWARDFNQPLNFDTSSVTTMRNMFYRAFNFDQDISNFDFSNVTNIENFISLTDMSVANNDALIQRWYDQLRTVSNLNPISEGLQYVNAETQRDYLINTMGWDFRDTKANVPPTVNDQTFTVDENSANGTVVGQVVATDGNVGQTLTYSIVSGNDLGFFALSSDGEITVADNTNLDYEQHTSVDLVVRVTDNGSPVLSTDATMTININDVNEPPVFTSADNASLNHNQTLSVTLTADDPENDSLTFSGNSLPSWVNVAGDQLVITPSYANIGTHQVELVVSDGTNQVTQQFTITVNEANVNPVINNQTFVVDENSANNTVIGQVAATDENVGQSLTYSIVSGNDLGIFALSNDGQITVANNTNLDYEQHTSVDLVVRVTDDGTPALSSEADVIININDINEAPIFTSADIVNLNHDQTLTHTLTATDPENDSLIFLGNSLPSWVSLNGDQLEITPSYANIGTHQVELVVSDGTNQVAQQLTIVVNESNIAPTATEDQTFSIDENSANGTVVGQVEATDPNLGQILTYTIVSGNDLGIFAITSDGQITIADSTKLDYEQLTSVSLTVRVTDNGSPNLSDEVIVVLGINDLPDTTIDNVLLPNTGKQSLIGWLGLVLVSVSMVGFVILNKK